MKLKLVFLLSVFCLPAFLSAQPYGISVDTNATIVRGTNFFHANKGLMLAELGPVGYVRNSAQIMSYSTNYAYWGASNYLARVHGFLKGYVYGGDDGGNPPGTIPMQFVGSFDGTNSWFVLTNGYATSNWISVSVLTNGFTFRGGSQVSPGNATLYTLDNWDSYGKTNSFDGQVWLTEGSPIASQQWVADYVANQMDGRFTSYTTNGVYHWVFAKNQRTMVDLASSQTWIPYTSTFNVTNINLITPATNLVTGWTVVSSTNLIVVNGFTTWTNFTISTNTGIVTITVPVTDEPQRFFNIVAAATNTATISADTINLDGALVITNLATAGQTNLLGVDAQGKTVKVALINGTNGAAGPQGPPGANGTNGTNGTNGATGATGPAGANALNPTNMITWPLVTTNIAVTATTNGDGSVNVSLTVSNQPAVSFVATALSGNSTWANVFNSGPFLLRCNPGEQIQWVFSTGPVRDWCLLTGRTNMVLSLPLVGTNTFSTITGTASFQIATNSTFATTAYRPQFNSSLTRTIAIAPGQWGYFLITNAVPWSVLTNSEGHIDFRWQNNTASNLWLAFPKITAQ